LNLSRFFDLVNRRARSRATLAGVWAYTRGFDRRNGA
jgi:hypothetical protein